MSGTKDSRLPYWLLPGTLSLSPLFLRVFKEELKRRPRRSPPTEERRGRKGHPPLASLFPSHLGGGHNDPASSSNGNYASDHTGLWACTIHRRELGWTTARSPSQLPLRILPLPHLPSPSARALKPHIALLGGDQLRTRV